MANKWLIGEIDTGTTGGEIQLPQGDLLISGWWTRGTVTPVATFGQVLKIDSVTEEFVLADANASATMPGIVLAVDTGTGADKRLLIQGYMRDDTWAWTPGASLYMSTTSGTLTQVKPTTLLEYTQPVGYAVTTTIIYFNPVPEAEIVEDTYFDVNLDDLTVSGLRSTATITPIGTFGQALKIDSGTGEYVLTDADASATMPCVALIVDVGAGADKEILLQGYMRDDTWAWTPGETLYVSTTPGELTQTEPTELDDYTQAVGYAVTATIIYFEPISKASLIQDVYFNVSLDDVSVSGLRSTGTTTPAVTFGQALKIDSGTGEYILTDADTLSTVPCVALAIDTGTGADKEILLQGYMRNDTWAWTPGSPLYVSTTAGALTQTKPTDPGDYTQVVGYAVTAGIIYFEPTLEALLLEDTYFDVDLDDLAANGFRSRGTVTPAATFAQTLKIDTVTGEYVLADASALTTMPCVALAVDTGTGASKSLLKQGFIRDDTWAWTPGLPIYVSTTSGALTQTAPSTTGEYAQAVGYAETATIVYFNPSMVMFRIA